MLQRNYQDFVLLKANLPNASVALHFEPRGRLTVSSDLTTQPVWFHVQRLDQQQVIGAPLGPFDENSAAGRQLLRELLENARKGVVYPPGFVERLERLLDEGGN